MANRNAVWPYRPRVRREQLFPELEQTPDLRRSDIRFAAEVAVAELHGEDVPSFAHERALDMLLVLARG